MGCATTRQGGCRGKGAAYLVEVLQNGLPKITPNGCLHFGDVISLDHIELFLLQVKVKVKVHWCCLYAPSHWCVA